MSGFAGVGGVVEAGRCDPFRRGLKSTLVLGALKPHGTRLRYMSGCRCDLCRGANTQYERDRNAARRNGDWNGVVPANAARDHIFTLAKQSVGYKVVADSARVSSSIIAEIKRGKRQFIRARTERKILAVNIECRADKAFVSAKKLWKQIDEIRLAGHNKQWIAQQLGYAKALQFNRKTVTIKNAARVEKLHVKLVGQRGMVSSRRALDALSQLRDEGFTNSFLSKKLRVEVNDLKPMITSLFDDEVMRLKQDLLA